MHIKTNDTVEVITGDEAYDHAVERSSFEPYVSVDPAA